MRCLARAIPLQQGRAAEGFAGDGQRFPLPGSAGSLHPAGQCPFLLRHAHSGQQPAKQRAGRRQEAGVGLASTQEPPMLMAPLPHRRQAVSVAQQCRYQAPQQKREVVAQTSPGARVGQGGKHALKAGYGRIA